MVGPLPELEHVYLNDNTFSGTIPLSLFNISRLRTLYMPYNSLEGSLPKEIANLSHLETLKLGRNKLTGSIPNILFNMSSLVEINLGNNRLSGELPNDHMCSNASPKLRRIFLRGNQLYGKIPANIYKCRELEVLRLQNNNFSGHIPPQIGSLPVLTSLSLSSNNFEGVPNEIKNLTSLERLSLSDNNLEGELPQALGSLVNLEFLSVRENFLSGFVPSFIFNLSAMKSLDLSFNQFSGTISSNFANRFSLYNLQELNLADSGLSGEIPSFLTNASKLTILSLQNNSFSGSMPDFSNLKLLRELYIWDNQLTGAESPAHELIFLASLTNCRYLERLELSGNPLNGNISSTSSNCLSGNISSQIGNFKHIHTLDLSFNHFLGDIPTVIDNCESLEFLSLSNNKLKGSIPESLGNIRGLIALDLSSNNLSGFIPKSLEGLKFLQYLNVSYNKLEGEIPSITVNSTTQSFVHNFALCGAAKFQVPPCPINHEKSKTLIFFKYIVPSLVVATILLVVVLMLKRRQKKIIIPPTADTSLGNFVRRRISYYELVRATNSFSETNLLGIGSFGSVYKATLSDGLNIAVKVFHLELERATKSFDTESEILSSIRHRNLLPVIGCCTNLEFKALILKYMPNGSLDKWLHSESNVLDLVQRLNIVIDVALALEYLHHDHAFPIVHCDIKPNNILLDEDMTAHVGDFGISKLFDEGEVMTHTTTLATIGYAAPEYGSEGKVSTAGDVYSYGILLLEMFTQKKPTNFMFSEEMGLKDWVKRALNESSVREIMAPGLVSGEDEHDLSAMEECVSSILNMAMKCLVFSPNERIDMRQVGAHLHKIKATVTTCMQQQEVNNKSTLLSIYVI